MENIISDNPADGCFLCDPEDWRIILETSNFLLLAGLGPLRRGYVILAPKEHIETMACLDQKNWLELRFLDGLIQSALQNTYGIGCLSYEHGKIGSCLTVETSQNKRSYCFHAHRVYVPVTIDLPETLAPNFLKIVPISSFEDLAALKAEEYIFAAVHGTENSQSWAFLSPTGIGSQFMRRVITERLGLRKNFKWQSDLGLSDVIATKAELYSKFAGLGSDSSLQEILGKGTLRQSISIDGLTATGKTTVGYFLAMRYAATLIDTGKLFWTSADFLQNKGILPGVSEIVSMLRQPYQLLGPHRKLVLTVQKLAANNEWRAIYRAACSHVAENGPPAIFVGRDAWQLVPKDSAKFLLNAEFELRVKRKILRDAELLSDEDAFENVRSSLRNSDTRDASHLPSASDDAICTIENSYAPLIKPVREIIAHLERKNVT